MKRLFTILMIMGTMNMANAQEGKATTNKKTFSTETSVSITIDADPAIIWTLLTNASDYPRWNSTILSMEGEIKLGEKIRLVSYLDSNRTFKPKVKEFTPETMMVWGDGQGKRTFTLTKQDGKVVFRMHEKIGGLMFPMYAGYLPDFDESFEKFAMDLKNEAEAIQRTKN